MIGMRLEVRPLIKTVFAGYNELRITQLRAIVRGDRLWQVMLEAFDCILFTRRERARNSSLARFFCCSSEIGFKRRGSPGLNSVGSVRYAADAVERD